MAADTIVHRRKRRRRHATSNLNESDHHQEDDQMTKMNNQFQILPTDVFHEILLRVPLQSLLKLCTVSKSFNRAIRGDPSFAHRHHLRNRSSPFLLVMREYYELAYLVDHPATPYDLKLDFKEIKFYNYRCPDILGSVNGLICFSPGDDSRIGKPYCIWNPVIQQHILIPPYRAKDRFQKNAFSGFGYLSSKDKYKLVHITTYRCRGYVAKAKIYTLGSGRWRKIPCVPSAVNNLRGNAVLVDESLYWLSKYNVSSSILSLNLNTEEFHVLELPHIKSVDTLESLEVIDQHLCLNYKYYSDDMKCRREIWMMKDSKKTDTWTKEYVFTNKEFIRGDFKSSGGHLLLLARDLDMLKLGYYDPKKDIFQLFGNHSYYIPHWPKTRAFVPFVGSLFSPKVIDNQPGCSKQQQWFHKRVNLKDGNQPFRIVPPLPRVQI